MCTAIYSLTIIGKLTRPIYFQQQGSTLVRITLHVALNPGNFLNPTNFANFTSNSATKRKYHLIRQFPNFVESETNAAHTIVQVA
ncbi:MAG: hypothetical protein ACRD4L_09180 [Pyrinomonadaceae bacterium]